MAYGEATIIIDRPPGDIIDFVMDLREYRKVDEKLGKIHSIEDAEDGNGVLLRFSPKVLGMPGPKTTQRVVAKGNRIDISGVPAWTDALMTFTAFFTCEETDEGTKVTRALNFDFKKPVAWLFNPMFNRWLAKAVPEELANAKEYLEAGKHLK
ncbi:SRPBCC family protein [Amycolatopsis nigrescens]|uniref:SRPBCC family protein n=1 Tax=Amycolatopsis nigrescens TaxID=381445 RepID=UPI00037DEA39|nr:SRPBCC family protein [Amycolatopsis nigrescens]